MSVTRGAATLTLVCAAGLLAMAFIPLVGDVPVGAVLVTTAVALAVGAGLPLVLRDVTRVPPLLLGLWLLAGAVLSLGFGQRDLVVSVLGGLLSGRLLGELVRARRTPHPARRS